jgi:kynurenine formamidase
MASSRRVPKYDDLPLSPFGARHSWDVPGCLGVGALGLITPSERLAAIRGVRKAEVISLVADLGIMDPPLFGRAPIRRNLQIKRDGLLIDESVDSFFPQVSSQWDGLNHVAAGPGVFYGDTPFEAQTSGAANGIDVWASMGIVGRGVLLDLADVVRSRGGPEGPGSAIELSARDLADAAAVQSVEIRCGDILIIRTGFFEWYATLDRERRAQYSAMGPQVTAAGVEHSEEIARFLWDSGVVAAATDSLGLEAWPPDPSPERRPFGLLHSALIGHLGIAIGELWKVDRLHARCAEDGRWDFLVVSVPLNLAGGTGSPSNAVAIL